MNYRLVLAKLQIHKPQTYVNQMNYRLVLAKLQNHKPQTYVNQMNYRLVLAKLRNHELMWCSWVEEINYGVVRAGDCKRRLTDSFIFSTTSISNGCAHSHYSFRCKYSGLYMPLQLQCLCISAYTVAPSFPFHIDNPLTDLSWESLSYPNTVSGPAAMLASP